MNRHELLSGLHQALAPRTYLEIGVNQGHSLVLSRARTIGIDPAFRVKTEVQCELQLAKATSDDFFARSNPTAWFPDGSIDLSLIDGLHIFEFALRDFMNCEKHSTPTSVAVFDDMLPRSVAEAARNRHTMGWTGDVYKVAMVLERYRPDLVVLPVDTSPTGVVVVVGLDPTSTVLTDHYDEILAEYITEDPQPVPGEYLLRTTSADPEKLLAAPVWADLVTARNGDGARPASLETLRELRSTANYVLDPPDAKPWPPVKKRGRAKGGPAQAATSPTGKRLRDAIKRRP